MYRYSLRKYKQWKLYGRKLNLEPGVLTQEKLELGMAMTWHPEQIAEIDLLAKLRDKEKRSSNEYAGLTETTHQGTYEK